MSSEETAETTAQDLSSIRREIDAIDDEMINLFTRRLGIVERVAASKKASGSPVFDPARERVTHRRRLIQSTDVVV